MSRGLLCALCAAGLVLAAVASAQAPAPIGGAPALPVAPGSAPGSLAPPTQTPAPTPIAPKAKTKAAAAPAGAPTGGQTEILADDGIEWDKERKTYTARGNARVARDELAVNAQQIVAFYRDKGQTAEDVYRVDAEGKVRFANKDSVVTSARATWDNEKKVLKATGAPLTFANPDTKLTARDSLEYFDLEKRAVARGEVVTLKDDERIRSDVLVAYFEDSREAGGEKRKLSRVEAFGGVVITSCRGIAHADKALYDPKTGLAVLTGSVRITRNLDQMNGDTAEYNSKTGFARITSGGSGQVRMLIEPGKAGEAPPMTSPTTGAPCKDDKPAAGG